MNLTPVENFFTRQHTFGQVIRIHRSDRNYFRSGKRGRNTLAVRGGSIFIFFGPATYARLQNRKRCHLQWPDDPLLDWRSKGRFPPIQPDESPNRHPLYNLACANSNPANFRTHLLYCRTSFLIPFRPQAVWIGLSKSFFHGTPFTERRSFPEKYSASPDVLESHWTC